MVPRDGKMRREEGTEKRDAGRGRDGDNDREVQSLNHSLAQSLNLALSASSAVKFSAS